MKKSYNGGTLVIDIPDELRKMNLLQGELGAKLLSEGLDLRFIHPSEASEYNFSVWWASTSALAEPSMTVWHFFCASDIFTLCKDAIETPHLEEDRTYVLIDSSKNIISHTLQ